MQKTADLAKKKLFPRHLNRALQDALNDTRVVLLTGARQCGKSTLVRQLATQHENSTRSQTSAQFRSLDRAATRQAALYDPTSFVDTDSLLIIDEVQRVPELLLAIKERVDIDPRPGQYLLTGSAQILTLRGVADVLPGRMETLELWPLSQGELSGTEESFVDTIFSQGASLKVSSVLNRNDYIDRIVRGGFPEAVAREGKRRERFLDNYLSDIINRDVIQISEIERGAQMRALVKMVAARSGNLLVPGSLANSLGISQGTINRYLGLLEEVFMIKRIPAWSRNINTRATATPKVAVVDSAIAANLIGQTQKSLRAPESPLGGLLEGFVVMEILRQLAWSNTRAELFHYRTKDRIEVDIVLEDRLGRVVAIEVKASSVARSEDFRGINHLANRLGEDLLAGVVLYTGTESLRFGAKNLALPVSVIWQ